MTLNKATEILREHNKWRRGDASKMLRPKIIGQAIDVVLAHLDNKGDTK